MPARWEKPFATKLALYRSTEPGYYPCASLHEGGELRLCIDFCKLNDKTKKNAFTMPNAKVCLNALSGNRYFSSLDFVSGYW